MKILKLFPAALAMVALASCSSDDVLNSNNWENELASAKSKLSVTVEELDPVTRASFAEIDSKNRTLVWQKGDTIRMLDSQGGSWNRYHYDGDEVSQAVDFVVTGSFNEKVEPTYGLYPHSDVVMAGYINDNTVPSAYMKIPAHVKYGETTTTDAGNVLPAYLTHLPLWGPTKAESTKENPVVGFYYLTAILRVELQNLTSSDNYLTVYAPHGEKLSGTFKAELDLDEPSNVELKDGTGDYICTEGYPYIIADLTDLLKNHRDGVVYLPIPAKTYEELQIYTNSTINGVNDITNGKLIKTIGGPNSDVEKYKGLPVTMTRKMVANFIGGNEYVEDEESEGLSGVNALLKNYTSDVHVKVKKSITVAADDYQLIVPQELYGKNVTVEFDGGLTSSSSDMPIVVSGAANSLTIVNNGTSATAQYVKIVTANGANTTLLGKYQAVTVDNTTNFGDGIVSIGDGTTEKVGSSYASTITANAGELNIASDARVQTVTLTDNVSRITVAGEAKTVTVAEGAATNVLFTKTAADYSGSAGANDNDDVLVNNAGTGYVTIEGHEETVTFHGAILSTSKSAVGGENNEPNVTIGKNVFLTGSITNNSTVGGVAVYGSVSSVTSASTVTVGTEDEAGKIRGTLTLEGGNANIVNGVAVMGITNNGDGNVVITKLSEDMSAGIVNTKEDGENTITITDGNGAKIAGDIEVKGTGTIKLANLREVNGAVKATTGAVTVQGKDEENLTVLKKDVTTTKGAISLTDVTAMGNVKSEEGNITLAGETSAKENSTAVETAGTVSIDCKDQRFTAVKFGTALDLKNGVVYNLSYTGENDYTVATAGKSAIVNVVKGADKLTFTSEWTGEAVVEVVGVNANKATLNSNGEIYTAAQLAAIANNASLTNGYVLKTDIEAKAGNAWPKVDLAKDFDGGEQTITIAELDVTEDNIGFFSTVAGGVTITNVNLTISDDIDATGKHSVGALIGLVNEGTPMAITNTSVTTKNIIADYNLGGIIGESKSSVSFGKSATDASEPVTAKIEGFKVTLEEKEDKAALYGTVGMFIGSVTKAEKNATVNVYLGCTANDAITGHRYDLGYKYNVRREADAEEASFFWGENTWVGYSVGLQTLNGPNDKAAGKYGTLDFNDFKLSSQWSE